MRHVFVDRPRVFDIIADPNTYPHWLVGCREIRSVDDGWPAKGAKFDHRVGLVGPLTIPDSTEVLDVEPPSLLVLEARARPFGRARVEFRLDEVHGAGGDRAATRISLDEVPLGLMAPFHPALEPLIRSRNTSSLNALVAYLNDPR